MRYLVVIWMCALAPPAVRAQEPPPAGMDGAVDVAPPGLPVVEVEAVFRDRTWFTDRVATTVVVLPEVVEPPEEMPDGGGGVAIAGVEVREAEEGSTVEIRWLPRSAGLVTFPSLRFASEKTRFVTTARQLTVSAPQRSEEMELVFSPGKHRIYAGEPLRLDVRWSCMLGTKRLRSLRCAPAFLNDEAIEVVVPRCTAPEKEQFGMPFGGRRIITRREVREADAELGVVRFPLFLRFAAPGTYTLPAVRLECAQLKGDGGVFAPYAAYFNNALFEPVEAGAAYGRVFTESAPVEIVVLPLPEEGRRESFSGLFAPCGIAAEVHPRECTVGTVLDLDLTVTSQAPHGFLEIPDLRRQRSLRSWFKVDGDPGRDWHPDGTRFRVRMRPLTTRVQAVPSVEIQVFDPEAGTFAMVTTDVQRIVVRSEDGRDYFDPRTLPGDAAGLTDQPEGVWHNDRSNPMNDVWNTTSAVLSEYFWLGMALGPVLFAGLLPWAREGRRRARNPAYRRLVEAYDRFRRLPEGGAEKWAALRGVLAAGFGIAPAALTGRDVRSDLAKLGVSGEDLAVLTDSVVELDAAEFSREKRTAVVPRLGGAGERIFRALREIVTVVVVLLMTGSLMGGEWSGAEALFAEAMQAEAGSAEAAGLFSQAALGFEAAARSGQRPGSAWLNAGNAWFEAGEIGRAIAGFRQAEVFRPFDDQVDRNLAAARALAVDVVDGERDRARWIWPARWLRAVLVPVGLAFWILLALWVRWRKRAVLAAAGVAASVSLGLLAIMIVAKQRDGREGVVIVPEVFGRKGPSYRYRTAFQEPLHDGLEFERIERRADWMHIRLVDGRTCWVPSGQVQLVCNPE